MADVQYQSSAQLQSLFGQHLPAGRLTPAARVEVAVKMLRMPFRNAFSTTPRSTLDNPRDNMKIKKCGI